MLDAFLADNRKARILLGDGTYIRAWQKPHGRGHRKPPVGAAAFNAQEFLINVAEGKPPLVLPGALPRAQRGILAGKER
jgi:hypothetical protein